MKLSIAKNNICEGDLVMLSSSWSERSVTLSAMANPYIGIVTEIRSAAGMYAGHRYVKVLWENNTHKEHHIEDLIKVKQ
tara:strand:+ start:499 stop:735 length:237 start_codon:yes stop_codon:yes gene_type:complete